MMLGQWIAAGIVIAVFIVFYTFLMRITVQMIRHDRLATGLVTEAQPHILSGKKVFEHWSAATATLDTGQTVPVTFDDPRSRQLLGEGVELEVLVLISSKPLRAKNASHTVVGFRPARPDHAAGGFAAG